MSKSIQQSLEEWWNEDPEMRYAEVLCGRTLRVCVRLYQITTEEPGFVKVGEAEAGALIDATRAAVTIAKAGRAPAGPPQGTELQDSTLGLKGNQDGEP